MFAVVGDYATTPMILLSSDGLHWQLHVINTADPLRAIAYGNESFVATCYYGSVYQSGRVAPPFQVSVSLDSAKAVVLGFEQGRFRISRTGNLGMGIDLKVSFMLSGTAQNGFDYQTINHSVIIPADQSFCFIPVIAQGSRDIASTKTLVLTLDDRRGLLDWTERFRNHSDREPWP